MTVEYCGEHKSVHQIIRQCHSADSGKRESEFIPFGRFTDEHNYADIGKRDQDASPIIELHSLKHREIERPPFGEIPDNPQDDNRHANTESNQC